MCIIYMGECLVIVGKLAKLNRLNRFKGKCRFVWCFNNVEKIMDGMVHIKLISLKLNLRYRIVNETTLMGNIFIM